MTAPQHAALGALVAISPDVVLATFGWRKRWLEPNHPLVRAHAWLHSINSIPFILAIAWGSHILADKLTHKGGIRWQS